MLYYHGTTDVAAKQIRRVGLKPHRESAYDMVTIFGDDMRTLPGEEENTLYVTADKRWAKGYAVFRTAYEKAKQGEAVVHPISGVPFFKKGEPCHCKISPVVVVLDVPERISLQLQNDPQDYEAKVCACVIGPEYIKEVIKL